jgi:hypothetical protein
MENDITRLVEEIWLRTPVVHTFVDRSAEGSFASGVQGHRRRVTIWEYGLRRS